MYEDHVLKHYGEPYHRGKSPGCTHTGHAVSAICGDEIHLELRIVNHVIIEFWWTGQGCCFSQAAASMLAEHFEMDTLEEVNAFTEDDMIRLFQAEVPDERRGCVLVAFNALKTLEEHR